jgi:hypothetical protein
MLFFKMVNYAIFFLQTLIDIMDIGDQSLPN